MEAGSGAVRALHLSGEWIHRTVRSIPACRESWRRAPYFDGLRAMAKRLLEQKRHVIMFVGDQATLVMPDETLSLGAMTANDNFRIEPALRPELADMARNKNMRTCASVWRPYFRQNACSIMRRQSKRPGHPFGHP